MLNKAMAIVAPILVVALIVLAAMGVDWLTGGWLPGWLAIVLLILSPAIVDIVFGLLGRTDAGAISFLLFPSVGFGVPALCVYFALMFARLI